LAKSDELRAYAQLFLEEGGASNCSDELSSFAEYIEENDPDLADEIKTKEIERILSEEKAKVALINKAKNDGNINIKSLYKKQKTKTKYSKEAIAVEQVDNLIAFPDIDINQSHSYSESDIKPGIDIAKTEINEFAYDPLRSKLIKIFEYLRSVYSMIREVVKHVKSYDELIYYHNLPDHSGCVKDFKNGLLKLVIEKQEIPAAPAPPTELEPWIEGDWRKPLSNIAVREVLNMPRNGSADEFEEIRFNDKANLRNLWRSWYGDTWKPWSEINKPRAKVQELYKRLFLMSQRIERQLDELELVWGHGMLYWVSGNSEVKHPIVTTKASLAFDETSGKVTILIPDFAEPKLEMEFLYSIKNTDMHDLTTLNSDFKENPKNPWETDDFEPFCKSLMNLLDPEGSVRLSAIDMKPNDSALITYEPVLILRKRRFGYRQDLEDIVKGLQGGLDIPRPMVGVIDGDDHTAEDSNLNLTLNEIKFPLAANDEQLAIVEKLRKHNGVTVQGPPGTGKSHTIANLISHMLSEGKKILVIAKAERPLRVLRKMIPESIRPFCVTLFSDESSSFNELEEAVKAISEITSSLDAELAEKELQKVNENIKEIRESIAKTRSLIKAISKQEKDKYHILGKELSLMELGFWLNEHESELGFIPDAISGDKELPLSQEELFRLFELSGIIFYDDKKLINSSLPDLNIVPNSSKIKEIFVALEYLESEYQNGRPISKELKDRLKDFDLAKAEALIIRAKQVLDEAEVIMQHDWLTIILDESTQQGMRMEFWERFYTWCKGKVQKLYELDEKTSACEIIIPEDRHMNELLTLVSNMEEYLQNRSQIGLFSKIAGVKFRYLISNCKVDGLRISNHSDVLIVKAEIEKRILKEKLIRRWNNDIVSINGPGFGVNEVRLQSKVDESVRLVKKALDFKGNSWEPLMDELCAQGLPVQKGINLKKLNKFIDELDQVGITLKIKEMKRKIAAIQAYLKDNQKSDTGNSSIWIDLVDSLDNQDWKEWDKIIKEVSRLKELQNVVKELDVLNRKLSQAAPLWAAKISSTGGNGRPLIPPDRYKEAWDWAKAETWLSKILENDPIELNSKLENYIVHEKKLVSEAIAISTQMSLKQSVTEEQRRSLIAWQQIVTDKIKKGTGKYVNRYRRDARLELQKARNAVPVWIMPFNKVIESFPSFREPFDLVIVDESSQIDIFGILAFSRAEKILIVGDDKQISPQGVGIERSSIHKLMDDYLKDIPHGNLFEPQYSLYDLAKQVFPGVIMLKEHFRCLPEIIQFSNDQMYQGDILPLRQKDSSLPDNWEPVVKVQIENGFRAPGTKINEPEAAALVQALVDCCNDSNYDGMTMGVISLLGADQGHLIEQMLFDALSPEEIKQRRLICGDAYYFQGDERDVIFMSMVDAKGENRLAVMSKTDDYKRFNVAASRAKNQMWLFNSLDVEDLNSNDVRFHLIRYFQNPHRLQRQYSSLEELCESEFEKKVLKDLLRLGYTVKPQHKVGHKRIDFVVQGLKRELAVECDGDAFHGIEQWEADWNRQVQLERSGWKFFRIRGSAYYRDPKKTIEELVKVLEDMEIYPLN